MSDLVRFSLKKPRDETLSGSKGARSSCGGHHRPIGSTPKPTNSSQRVIVKAAYAGSKKLQAHINYLMRESAGEEGQKPDIFSSKDSPEPDIERLDGEERFFKFIVSPEYGDKFKDFESFTRDVMKNAEKTLGAKLDWSAVAHHNTDNPHVHIIVRGITRDGKDFSVIDPRFMKEGMRNICQHHATNEIGPRTRGDIQRAKDREIKAERFTSLDRSLVLQHEKLGVVKGETPHEKERLQYLKGVGLAAGMSDGRHYKLKDNIGAELREIGKQNDIMKRVYNTTPPDFGQRLTVHKAGMDMEGAQVIKTGVADELRDRPYAVAVNKGKHYYIEGRSAEGLQEGMELKGRELDRKIEYSQNQRNMNKSRFLHSRGESRPGPAVAHDKAPAKNNEQTNKGKVVSREIER